MKPSVSRRGDALQLTYDFPHRIFATRVYPCQAPNGSTVIIYGHEEGLRILWFGGRPFKQAAPALGKTKVNGTRSDDAMVIDLEDDEPPLATSTPQTAEFEEDDVEIDPFAPYQNILRLVDIPFGSSARHLALPHIPRNISQSPLGAFPAILSSHIVVVAACDDLSIRLVTLPLSPPSPTSEDPIAWGVQTLKIFDRNTHQDLLSSIAITHTYSPVDPDGEPGKSESRSRSRGRLAHHGVAAASSDSEKRWSFLLASTSPTAGGLIVFHEIPLISDTTLSTSPEIQTPLQWQYLRSPFASCKLDFNPCPCPAERHSNILVASPDNGCVKIYQVFSDASSAFARGRRGSTATSESITFSSRSIRDSPSRMGRFLVTLYPGFSTTTDPSPISRRKRVLDASWVLGGRAVLALLEDGEWGIWDIEGAGPSTTATSQRLFKGQGGVSGIQGGALTRFALRSSVPIPGQEASKAQQSDPDNIRSGRLAPMTPHTRKLRSDGLFRGGDAGSLSNATLGGFVHGSICVTEHSQSTSQSSSTATDELILLGFGNTIIWIPSLLSFWRAEMSGKGSFDSSTALRPSLIPALQLGGERQARIDSLPRTLRAASNGPVGVRSEETLDVLISTEHRLIALVSALSEPASTLQEPQIPGKTALNLLPKNDQVLLGQGDLDVDGMDRILDGMSNRPDKALNGFDKSVGFDLDDDGDLGMGTPTPTNIERPKQSRTTPRIGATRSSGRRVFT